MFPTITLIGKMIWMHLSFCGTNYCHDVNDISWITYTRMKLGEKQIMQRRLWHEFLFGELKKFLCPWVSVTSWRALM